METNLNIKEKSELYKKGKALIKAAQEYWEEYQKNLNPCSVVWLKSDDSFILFTRGEYKDQIMHNIFPLSKEHPMVDPL